MKKSLESLVLLLMALMVPVTATAAYEQLADGVYQDGTTLYITSGVTSLGDLQVNPSEIYCYATIPPACVSNTFTGYDATLHVPAAGMVSYFTTLYWYNFNNILSDAIEPLSVTMNTTEAELEIDQQLSLSATVVPGDATPKTVYWTSTDTSVATVSSGGKVTAIAVGECDILAACVDKVAICHMTVVPSRVTITLDKHEARLLPNHTITLTATCSPVDVDLSVTSSNSSVAIPRIVNGTIMVVGVAEGTATITVNAADGWGSPDQCVVTVYTELGDVNCDGYVNIADVTSLIDYLLGDETAVTNAGNADVNSDGTINIADVTELIDYLLNGMWPWDEQSPKIETFTVNGVSFKMVTVEGGTFTMGASGDDSDANNSEKPAHEVTLSSYYIGDTEVTQELWLAVMGSNPSYFSSSNNYNENLQRPVEYVSWNDCQSFIAKLNHLTGRNFRLPTEAEWEFAARGGNKSQYYKYAGSNTIDDVAWYTSNSGSTTHPVAIKAPNELGLYDMSGNVSELCQDWYGSYSSYAQTNPTGPTSGSSRMLRGGAWSGSSWYCRVVQRVHGPQTKMLNHVGLRLALDTEDSNKFRLSETVVTAFVGESKMVKILNGNGNYTVEGGSDNVTCTINGNNLYVTGANEGTTTVHVTNTSTGATAVLTVIIKGSETFTINGVTFKMVAVEGGSFTMGGTAEQGSNNIGNDELPTHQVTLSSFVIGETEVTQELWQAVMGNNPSYFKHPQCPVERVSWDDCQVFISTLNQLTGKTFRLPTEAEWEFAARGGNQSQHYRYAGSNNVDEVAVYRTSNTLDEYTHEYNVAGNRKANELGVYDMSGNVFEWCQDWYGSYSSEPQFDPTGLASGTDRVIRGGSWYTFSTSCRVSCRNSYPPARSSTYIGLRLAM